MILPDKHLSAARSLFGVGGDILAQLNGPVEVTDLWDAFQAARGQFEKSEPVSFDWFVAALTFLYTIGAVHLADGLIEPGMGAQ